MHNRDTSPIIIHEISSSRPAFKQPVIATLIPLEEQHHSENAKWRNKRPPSLPLCLYSPQRKRKRKKNDRVVSQSLRDRIVAIFFSSSFLFFVDSLFSLALYASNEFSPPPETRNNNMWRGRNSYSPRCPQGTLHAFAYFHAAFISLLSLSFSASCTHVSVHIFFRYKSRNGRVNEAQKFIKSSHPFSRRGG